LIVIGVMRKILLIGGNGYIGSRLYNHLTVRGYDVDNLDSGLFGLVYSSTIVKDFNDITSKELEKYTHIILLAGFSSVGLCQEIHTSIKYNVEYFNNLVSKLNVDQVLIYASSCSVYGNSDRVLNEDDLLSPPLNIYDFTKQTIDYISSFTKNKRCVGLRFGTVNGFSPNMRMDLVVNAMTLNGLEKGTINVSNKNTSRSLLGLNDLCKSIERIILTDNVTTGVYNLTSTSATIIQIAEKIQTLIGCEMVVDDTMNTNYSFSVNNNKFTNRFDFKFSDTIESMYNDIVSNVTSIKNRSNRSKML
jgi:UDP-glucose 4-epimerase